MANLIPFKAVRPQRDKVHLLCSRPFYTYKKSHLKAKLKSNPYSFLHVINPEFNALNKTVPNSNERFKLVKNKYEEFKKNKFLFKDKEAQFYIYRQTTEFGIFQGIIAGASVEDYQSNIIKKHENTIQNRENIFKKYLDITNFHAEPVLLAYNPTKLIKQIIAQNILERPEYEFTTTDRKVHELWLVNQSDVISKIKDEFKLINNIYIADGHHRIASSSIYKQSKQNHFLSNYFLSFFIDQKELKIFEFNRYIKSISPLNEEEFLERIKINFNLKLLEEHQPPSSKNELSIYLKNKWYLIKIKPQKISNDFKSQLNSQIVSDFILKDILNIKTTRKNRNIEYIKGNQPIEFLVNKVDNNKMSLAIQLYPHKINEITTMADLGDAMPAKSTWIEPKLRSGLTIYEY